MKKIYICIDLKSFFASCECSKRNLDPFTTNLVVADKTRGENVLKASFIILNAIYSPNTINDWIAKIQENEDFSDCRDTFYDNGLYNIETCLHRQFEMWIFELRKAKEQLQNKNTL